MKKLADYAEYINYYSYVREINAAGTTLSNAANNSNFTVRPSITLKQGIKITDGNGMQDNPFEISE